MADKLDALEETIGWAFEDRSLLREALTHSTHHNEYPAKGPCNERLEFVGDAVLDLVVAQLLYESENRGEGEMSRRRARVVRQNGLADLALQIGLEKYLRLGQGQTRAGMTPSILADGYEALAAAVFLDGGYQAAYDCFAEPLAEAIRASHRLDFKTSLQELCHKRGLPIPIYEVISTSGPDHDRRFTCQVSIDNEVLGTAEASSKKAAQQACAKAAFELVLAKTEQKASRK